MRNPRIVFEWQRAHSEASRAGWQTRWEKAYEAGKPLHTMSAKAQAHIERTYERVSVPGGYDYEEPDWYDTDDYLEY